MVACWLRRLAACTFALPCQLNHIPPVSCHSSGATFAKATGPSGWSNADTCFGLQLVPGAPSTLLAFCKKSGEVRLPARPGTGGHC